ncbi:oxidoreductase [Rhizobium sp. ARZ01]|uniref:MDR family oxidoreductase n=1 Tax=Rhizobium sp. ARZ01 TaxID=2769313 RepID=UPI0017859DDE|nr:MDR family oxidoreductase [Rhizobium sp. ARZ01]MBD9375426.1 oxidoreductase [Rhizobium sp. ARZ01]
MSEHFDAMVVEDVDGKPHAQLRKLTQADLPDHDVLVEVAYSSLNYKDGLAIAGKGRIARRVPMVGGIDLAGTVVDSRSPDWKKGDLVVVNGWGLSETEWGGYSRFQRVKPEWLLKLPEAFSLQEAMAIGTAGYTAALCVDALEDWGRIEPGTGEVLVTGAAGGVGSVGISLLAAKGYNVVASTGRPELHDYLKSLGASEVIDRSVLGGEVKPLQKERWTGGIDTVGTSTLANALAQTAYGAAMTACGLAGASDLPATVFPHILRSVALIGVDSVYAPFAKRKRAWATLAEHIDRTKLAAMTHVYSMRDLPDLANSIVSGKIQGRVVIEI